MHKELVLDRHRRGREAPSVVNKVEKVRTGAKESLEDWKTHNCAECDALNNALNDGAKIKDLEMHTLKLNSKTGKLENFTRCANCKVTAKDVKTTSDNP